MGKSIGAIIIVWFLLAASFFCKAEEIDQALNTRYNHKTFFLRGFYSGEKLAYNAFGSVHSVARIGDWTSDGVVFVHKIHLSSDILKIDAFRCPLLAADGFRPKKNTSDLHIEVRLGSEVPTVENLASALDMVFLTSNDSFLALVPGYWRPCIAAGVLGRDSKKYPRCRMAPEFLAIPGAATPPQNDQILSQSLRADVHRSAQGLTRAMPIKPTDPGFTDEALKMGIQGSVTLSFVVEKTGEVTGVHIVSPLGLGLDQRAVEQVSTWRFRPAVKGGEPVAVELVEETQFHLF